MERKISYEPLEKKKNDLGKSTKPYCVQKPIPDSKGGYFQERRYNEKGIKSYIITATRQGIELLVSDSVPQEISEFIESQKNKWNVLRVSEQKV